MSPDGATAQRERADPVVDPEALRPVVQAELDRVVRARLHSHYGDAEIESIGERGEVVLRFTGFCTSCPLRPMTYAGLVVPALERIDGVSRVDVVGLDLSPAAHRRIRTLAMVQLAPPRA